MLGRCCENKSGPATSRNIFNHQPRMCNIALSRLQLHLVNLSGAGQCQQATAGGVCVAPMCQPKLYIILGFYRQRKTRRGTLVGLSGKVENV
jgi:hypothetical protein